MQNQKPLPLALMRLDGEPRQSFKIRQAQFAEPHQPVSPEKLFADLLKRHARRIMAESKALTAAWEEKETE